MPRWKDTFSPYLQTIFFVCFSQFCIFDFFTIFSFSLTWDHMGEKTSNDISSQNYKTDSLQKFTHISREGLYQNCIKIGEISNLGILPILFSFSLTWDYMGVKVSNDILSESAQQIYCSQKIMHTPMKGRYQRIVKFQILDFWQLFLFFFGTFNMVVNGELQNMRYLGNHCS